MSGMNIIIKTRVDSLGSICQIKDRGGAFQIWGEPAKDPQLSVGL